MKGVLVEAAWVALCGGLVAFGANALSPKGLKLTTNFFPTTPPALTISAPVAVVGVNNSASTNFVTEAVAAQLRQEGLGLVDHQEMVKLFHDPGYLVETIVFVDARDDDHYQERHIPGAYQLDHYHAEKYLPEVIPICQKATRVVVYCNGGDCEDSKFAAIMLRDAGISKEKLGVYLGGITEWQSLGLPQESGSRIPPPQGPGK